MKRKEYGFSFGSCFQLVMKIWGTAWLSFLISVIPLAIWRACDHSSADIRITGEGILMSIVGITAGFLILFLLHGRSDDAERLSNREMWLSACTAVGIYLAAWIVLWMIGRNNYLVAALGYHLQVLLAADAGKEPALSSVITAALIYGVSYFSAVIAGTKMAHRRRRKRNTHPTDSVVHGVINDTARKAPPHTPDK